VFITDKGQIKFTKLVNLEWENKYLRREQKLNLWVFKTVSEHPRMDADSLSLYLESTQTSWENVLEVRDYFRQMLPHYRLEIDDWSSLPDNVDA